jgi:hypothetical protein
VFLKNKENRKHNNSKNKNDFEFIKDDSTRNEQNSLNTTRTFPLEITSNIIQSSGSMMAAHSTLYLYEKKKQLPQHKKHIRIQMLFQISLKC